MRTVWRTPPGSRRPGPWLDRTTADRGRAALAGRRILPGSRGAASPTGRASCRRHAALPSRIRQGRPRRCRWYAVARPAWPAPMIAVSMCSMVMGISGGDVGRRSDRDDAVGVTQVPEEHQSRRQDVEAVQGPDRAGWQLKHVDAVHCVADVGQHQVSPAVGARAPWCVPP